MKQYAICALIFLGTSLTASAFTETETVDTNGLAGGYAISGTGSASQLAHNPYEFFTFAGTLNFDDDTTVSTTNSSAFFGSAYYSMKIGGNSTINMTGSGSLILAPNQNNVITGMTINAPTTINIGANSGGIITSKICAIGATNMTLDKENAILRSDGKAVMFTNVSTVTINMTQDQRMGIDMRPSVSLNLNMTNDSVLFIDRVDSIFKSESSAKIKLLNDFTESAIYFEKSIVATGYDETTGKLVVKKANAIETLEILNSAGQAFKDLNWYEDTVNGTDYWVLTAAVPEPAEWAAIFGTFAMALALYRRKARK